MKKIIKLIFITTLLFVLSNNISYAQYGWQSNTYYVDKGTVNTEVMYTSEINSYGYVYSVKWCRTVVWHNQYRNGYVYEWINWNGIYQWRRRYMNGNYWYYTWTPWRRC